LLEKAWYSNQKWVWLLAPLSLLFWLISSVRKTLINRRKNVSKSCSKTGRKVPVIVIGNITVGGTGKTPFVIELVAQLQKQGYKPGIVSRGYGALADKDVPASKMHFPRNVNNIDNIKITGDEAKLIAVRTQCPVVIDPDRTAAVDYLLNQTDVDVILSDDGLQHYKMARDLEIVLVDGLRKYGNGLLLPMGPLRENISRLKSVDLTVVNSGVIDDQLPRICHDYMLKFDKLINIASRKEVALELEHRNVHLVSGIGNPKRFKDTAKMAGLNIVSEHWFNDHHDFDKSDFVRYSQLDPETDIIVMTEKDGVKCRAFGQSNWYELPISAKLSSSVIELIFSKLSQIVKSKF
jgi:tetraacyldisaccharide 4'-kinase